MIDSTETVDASAAIFQNTSMFVKYLKQLVSLHLGNDDDNNNNNSVECDKCRSEKANIDCIKKFVGEPHVRTLTIRKLLSKRGQCRRFVAIVYFQSLFL